MKFDAKNLALAFSITAGIANILCSLFSYLFPKTFFAAGSYLFHGIELSKTVKPALFSEMAGGLALTVIISYVAAYFFATIYNYVDTEE